ncbi:hypothetical protein BDD26_0613 [Xenorhabdus cabanillasii]|uniref:Uncharacterized protein n=1 Tax=Xenorhabdus cabanillasii TaxID=351673 RepID=A0A3D9U9B3_9GAMM|nr:hypothetical protein [Xenorhabdus cabanillasii]REF26049.1 hypothetical protein BDD26_0613 [Xenorhabdus cabanillasii]
MRYIILSIFFITACSSPKVNFIPESSELPNALINKDYETIISIYGETSEHNEFLSKRNLFVNITPPDSGIIYEPTKLSYLRAGEEKVRDNYNKLIIKGKPIILGDVKINISGFTYGTMYTSGSEFNKTYTIKVKE